MNKLTQFLRRVFWLPEITDDEIKPEHRYPASVKDGGSIDQEPKVIRKRNPKKNVYPHD